VFRPFEMRAIYEGRREATLVYPENAAGYEPVVIEFAMLLNSVFSWFRT